MYLAEVVSGDEWTVPYCLACALAHPLQTSSPFRIQVHHDVPRLESIAQSFEQMLRQPQPHNSMAGMYCARLHHAAVLWLGLLELGLISCRAHAQSMYLLMPSLLRALCKPETPTA